MEATVKKILLKTIVVLVLAVMSMPALAKDKNKTIESYKANAIVQTGGGASMAEINIYRWSTDDERGELLEAIKAATNDKRQSRLVAQALRGQEKAGYAFFAGKQGYPLRYARSFDMGGGKRQVILATDRPVSFQEVYNQTQLGDFDVSLIILNLDESGKGDGVLSLGTEVKWNDKEGKIEMTNVSSQPIRLGDVRKTK
jgi:hypothetical protein